PFKFLFKYNKREHSTKLSRGFSTDQFIDGSDLTIEKLPNRPTTLTSRNGATSEPNGINEACESQILHKVFLKEGVNFRNFSNTIKEQANVEVEVKFYLIPVQLQSEDPQNFFVDEEKFKKLLDVGGFEYEESEEPIKVKLLYREKNGNKRCYYPKHDIFTTQELNNLNKTINLNNISDTDIINLYFDYDYVDNYSEFAAEIKPKPTFKNFFGSYVVFDNQFYDKNSRKIKYKHDWLNQNPIEVKLLSKTKDWVTKRYLPKNDMFTTQDLNDLNGKTNLNNISDTDIINLYDEYKGSDYNYKKEVKPKQTSKILSPKEIFNSIESSTKQYYIYGDSTKNITHPTDLSNFKFPKLITKNDQQAPDNYDKIETLILINFWNEMSLNDDFFTVAKRESDQTKDFYTDASHDLTLFTQITYTLVDNEGNCHKLETGNQGTKLTDMKLNDSKAGTGGGSGRKITVRAKQPRTQDNTQIKPITRSE
ncbi:hypothetical protein, partial [Candidatus Phytoplasma sp. AldY-WA1]|uniref:hypothetical protein n=1 Tax=Candidatus Phytoplasma sp. AldY-WA1 TaxID=2852100 RepID=UPI00254F832C